MDRSRVKGLSQGVYAAVDDVMRVAEQLGNSHTVEATLLGEMHIEAVKCKLMQRIHEYAAAASEEMLRVAGSEDGLVGRIRAGDWLPNVESNVGKSE